jgi:hypothetical protein
MMPLLVGVDIAILKVVDTLQIARIQKFKIRRFEKGYRSSTT